MKKTNFDRFLETQMQEPAFAARFKQAGEAWDIALQIAALRQARVPRFAFWKHHAVPTKERY